MHPQHERKFRSPIEGEYEEPWYRLPQMAAGWIIEKVSLLCQARLDAMPEGYHRDRVAQGNQTLMKAVRYIVAQVERGHGRRFQISTRSLAMVIGMSQSTASRCLKRLREMGILHRYRAHRVTRHKRRWLGKAAIHEVVTHEKEAIPEGDESRPVTCEKTLSEEHSDGSGTAGGAPDYGAASGPFVGPTHRTRPTSRACGAEDSRYAGLRALLTRRTP